MNLILISLMVLSAVGIRAVPTLGIDFGFSTVADATDATDRLVQVLPDIGVTVPQFLEIQSNMMLIVDAFSTSASIAEAMSSLNEADATRIAASLTDLKPKFVNLLTDLKEKTPALEKIQIPGGTALTILRQDMVMMQSSQERLEDAVAVKCSPGCTGILTAFWLNIEVKFDL